MNTLDSLSPAQRGVDWNEIVAGMHEQALALPREELDNGVRGRRAQALHKKGLELARVDARVLAHLGEQRSHDFVVFVGAVLGLEDARQVELHLANVLPAVGQGKADPEVDVAVACEEERKGRGHTMSARFADEGRTTTNKRKKQ